MRLFGWYKDRNNCKDLGFTGSGIEESEVLITVVSVAPTTHNAISQVMANVRVYTHINARVAHNNINNSSRLKQEKCLKTFHITCNNQLQNT